MVGGCSGGYSGYYLAYNLKIPRIRSICHSSQHLYYCGCDRSALFDSQRLYKISRVYICCFHLGQYNFSGLYFRWCAWVSRHYLYDDNGACQFAAWMAGEHRNCCFEHGVYLDTRPFRAGRPNVLSAGWALRGGS